MRHSRAAFVATVAALGLVGAGTLEAQVPPTGQAQQQMQLMQEQMRQMDQTIQRMAQVQQRAQEMEQVMLQDMERLRQQEAARAEGAQLQVQERLQQQEHIRLMAHSVANAAGEMNQAMIALRQMAQESGDHAMVREMERLRLTMQESCSQMEAGLRIMEQLRDRLSQS